MLGGEPTKARISQMRGGLIGAAFSERRRVVSKVPVVIVLANGTLRTVIASSHQLPASYIERKGSHLQVRADRNPSLLCLADRNENVPRPVTALAGQVAHVTSRPMMHDPASYVSVCFLQSLLKMVVTSASLPLFSYLQKSVRPYLVPISLPH